MSHCDFAAAAILSSGLTLTGNSYRTTWSLNGAAMAASAGPYPALTYSLTGSTRLSAGAVATYTLAIDPGTTVNEVTITPTDGSGSTFVPASVQLSTTVPTAAVAYTPTKLGQVVVATANDQGWLDPDPIDAVTTAPATTYTLQPPSPATALVGSPSDAFTVSLLPFTTAIAPVTVTITDGGGGQSRPASSSSPARSRPPPSRALPERPA